MPPEDDPPVPALPVEPNPAPRRRRRVILPVMAALLVGVATSVAVFRAREADVSIGPVSAPVPVAETGIAAAAVSAREPLPDESALRRADRRAAILAAEAEIADANQVIFALGRKHNTEVFRTSDRVLDWHADLRHQPHPESVLFELNFGGCLPMFPRSLKRRGAWPTRNEVEVALMQMRIVRAMPPEEARAVEEAFLRRDAAEARIRAAEPHSDGIGIISGVPGGL